MAQHRGLAALGGDCRGIRCQGSKLYVEGKIQTSSWEDRQSGERKYRTEIVARDLLLLGPRENGGGDHQGPTPNGNKDQRSHAGSSESRDEDIPF